MSSYEIPVVHETALAKSMVFSDIDIQSCMSVARPDELQFEYTRLMMGVLLFQPQPKRILMVGLGGGSLAKFCCKHLPDTHITVVEINPHVIALRQSFCIPDDDARFQVLQMDAADFMAHTEQTFDVVMIDGFDPKGMPEQLGSTPFYSDCRRVLTSGGVAVANLHRFGKYLDVYVDRISSVFEGDIWAIDAPGTTNCIVFAMRDFSKETPLTFSKHKPAHMSEAMWEQVRPSMARVFLATKSSG
nr:fused MFS/spermidine synthase [uncultured Limnohabitans sp.]